MNPFHMDMMIIYSSYILPFATNNNIVASKHHMEGVFFMDQLYNYAQVANNCSRFTPNGSDEGMSNVNNDIQVADSSCLKCQHFKEYHCELDLYDKIEHNLTKYSSEL